MREVRVRILLPELVYQTGIRLLLLYRKIRFGYAFRRIPLTQGKFAIVDPERYEELARHKWFAAWNKSGYYAKRMVKAEKGSKARQKCVNMHSVILSAPKGKVIDHINHNSLDNRIANLRIVTPRQNSWNRRKRKGNCTSKYKGVSRVDNNGKWRAIIIDNGRKISIGHFDDEKAAARAYDAKAGELFGEYAAPNF